MDRTQKKNWSLNGRSFFGGNLVVVTSQNGLSRNRRSYAGAECGASFKVTVGSHVSRSKAEV